MAHGKYRERNPHSAHSYEKARGFGKGGRAPDCDWRFARLGDPEDPVHSPDHGKPRHHCGRWKPALSSIPVLEHDQITRFRSAPHLPHLLPFRLTDWIQKPSLSIT